MKLKKANVSVVKKIEMSIMKQFLTRTKQKQKAIKSNWLKTSTQMLPIFTKNNFSEKHQT